jgi:hypothetical protein
MAPDQGCVASRDCVILVVIHALSVISATIVSFEFQCAGSGLLPKAGKGLAFPKASCRAAMCGESGGNTRALLRTGAMG